MEATANKRKHFTQEKEDLIVKEHLSSGISVRVLVRKYGIQKLICLVPRSLIDFVSDTLTT